MIKIAMNWNIVLPAVGAVLVISTFSSLIEAQEGTIPGWVKDVAGFWSDGQISEGEFVSAMQYLISQDIVTIPIKSVVAADANLADSERAMSIVVHYGGEVFGAGETIYTYSEFLHLSSSVRTGSTGVVTVETTTPTFYLAGLPSHDKKTVYELVDQYVNPSRPPAEYDVQVDIIAGDGKVIQTWDYSKCNIKDYVVFLESSKDKYRFSDSDEAEIREILLWQCRGYHLLV